MSANEPQAMPGWYWPDDLPKAEYEPSSGTQSSTPQSNSQPQNERPRRRFWPPRQCRICLETVQPTYHTAPEHLPGIFQSGPSVTYESEEGRLLRPCKCKGSSKYVHEGCLQAWRHSDPSYGRRNYWQCPTCGFRYRLARLGWGRSLASKTAQISLTVGILILAVFFLGFVADPIINLYLDPYSYFSPFSSSQPEYYYEPEEKSSWVEHFLKGFTSMGVLGFLKVLLSNPFSYFRLGGGGTRGRATGRDRYEQVSWIVILVGVSTFLFAVYKGVRAWSRRTLEKAGEQVMDVQPDDDDDEDDQVPPAETETL
ncbi:hypothetical protein BU16DRAFT_312031 [Lophium mytilinum]|uniref:RING-CH-type domain-containing protein n=1 Tax=Lophium mytilinum TaxID=390894 RepID=A0A6A6QYN4_9PEZI|nr:hypothetical protein BU16DRAFT_312031 [Lophium mytilinum]